MTKAVVIIRLEMEGNRDDAFRIIDWVLDEGILQDAINTCEGLDGVGQVRVTSAMSHPEER